MENIDTETRGEIENTLRAVRARQTATRSELMGAAQCLAAMRRESEAEQIFLALCQDKDVSTAEVDAFVALCGQKPGRAVEQWFTALAATERWERWRRLDWLNRLGLPEVAVRTVERVYQKVELDYLAEYLAALRNSGRAGKAAAVLDRYPPEDLVQADLRERYELVGELVKAGRTEWARQLLESLTAGELLERFSASDIAGMYVAAGMEKEGLQRLSGAGGNKAAAREAMLYLHAYMGDGRAVTEWLRKDRRISEPVMVGLYYFAGRARQNALALLLARELYRKYPSTENRLRLAESLVAEKDYGVAIEMVGAEAEQDRRAQDIYLNAVSGLALAGKFQRDSAEAVRFLRLCDGLTSKPETPEERIVTIAYTLMNAGYNDRAKGLFYKLAGKYPTLKKNFVRLYLYSTILVPERQDFKNIRALLEKIDRREEPELLALLEVYGMQGQMMLLIGKYYGKDVPRRLYSTYLDCLLKCRQMRQFNAMAEKLPPPVDFSEKERGEIFITLMLGGRDAQASIYYDALSKGKKDMPVSLVRRLAYFFANNRDYGKATALFFELAKNSDGPESSDVSLLVSLPGVSENERVVSWLTAQARRSKGDAQLKWLEYLNYAKHPEVVVDILKGYYEP